MSFKKSYLLPIDDYDHLVFKNRATKNKNVRRNNMRKLQKVNLPMAKVSRRLFLSNASKRRMTHSKKRHVVNILPDTNVNSMAAEINSIKKNFLPEEQRTVQSMLNIFLRNRKAISWDPQNFEIILNERRYPGSNLIDILTYLVRNRPRKKKKKSKVFYMSANYQNQDSPIYGIPQNLPEFLTQLQEITPGLSADSTVNSIFQAYNLDRKKLDEAKRVLNFRQNQENEKLQKEHEYLDKKRRRLEDNAEKLKEGLDLMRQQEVRKELEKEMNSRRYHYDPYNYLHGEKNDMVLEKRVRDIVSNVHMEPTWERHHIALAKKYASGKIDLDTYNARSASLRKAISDKLKRDRAKLEEKARSPERGRVLEKDDIVLVKTDEPEADEAISLAKAMGDEDEKTVAEQAAEAQTKTIDEPTVRQQINLRSRGVERKTPTKKKRARTKSVINRGIEPPISVETFYGEDSL